MGPCNISGGGRRGTARVKEYLQGKSPATGDQEIEIG